MNLFLYKQTIEPERILADIKYFSIMDFIPTDESEPDYAGAVFWCVEAALGPKKVNIIFDLIMLLSFSYLGYYFFSLFFLVSLVFQVLIDMIVFSIFPMLDMPYVPWKHFYDIIKRYADSGEVINIDVIRA